MDIPSFRATTPRPARLNVQQHTNVLPLDDGRYLLKVVVELENIGQVRVTIIRWRLRAEKMLPLTPRLHDFLASRSAFTEREAPWTTVAGKDDGEFIGPAFKKILEPGEVDRATGNLVIPSGVEVARVYSHFTVAETPEAPGWPTETIVHFPPSAGALG